MTSAIVPGRFFNKFSHQIFSVKQQFYLCLHAGLQYNGIDCGQDELIGSDQLSVTRCICQALHQGICWVLVWYLSGFLMAHLTDNLSEVCQGISWSVCCSNCQGSDKTSPHASVRVCVRVSVEPSVVVSINLNCIMYKLILNSQYVGLIKNDLLTP